MQFPNLIFKYEPSNNNDVIDDFIAYYVDGHDLFGDGPLGALLKNENKYIFSMEPFNLYPKDVIND